LILGKEQNNDFVSLIIFIKNKNNINCFKTNDSRPILLAYSSRGAVAGRPEMVNNKGKPSCIGVGLMKKLSKQFLVTITPEHGTSKTGCRCFGSCDSWKEVGEWKNER
jgi:hypothetical protein